MTLFDKIMALYPELTQQDFMTVIRLRKRATLPEYFDSCRRM